MGKCGGCAERPMTHILLQKHAAALVHFSRAPGGRMPSGRDLARSVAGQEGDSSPVGLGAQAVQHVCLVQVSREAMQHPPFLNAVLLAQAMAQHLHDDAVRDCGEKTSDHLASLGTSPAPTAM